MREVARVAAERVALGRRARHGRVELGGAHLSSAGMRSFEIVKL